LQKYWEECATKVDRWNKILQHYEHSERVLLPSLRFNRGQGVFRDGYFDPHGKFLGLVRPGENENPFLPTNADREYVKSCMKKVIEPGKFINWIAPPVRGINGQPVEFEYVKFH